MILLIIRKQNSIIVLLFALTTSNTLIDIKKPLLLAQRFKVLPVVRFGFRI